jgi:hypothetical protein
MSKKRTIARMAALGGMTAAVALLSGTPMAKADELSDLRANQELLQRRLDQLAQATAGGGVPALMGGPQAGVPMAGGSFPRSFLIPGTDTSIRIGGEIRINATYYLNGGAPNASPQGTNTGATGQGVAAPLNIHVPVAPGTAGAVARARSTDIFQMSAQQSKINFETRTPTAWGEARTFMEFDWAGGNQFLPGGARGAQGTSSNLIPRLRFAYGTLGGLLAGQANSNFSDPDAGTETLDFGGNVGDPGFTRVAQVRYTMPLDGWGLLGALSGSVETPDTEGWIPSGIIGSDAGATAITAAGGTNLVANNPMKATAPDLTAAWYIPQAWGHVDFSAVVRPGLQMKDGVFIDRNFVGWGLHFGGDVKPNWFGFSPKDDITWNFVYGDGIGRYLNESTTFAIVSNYPAAAPATQAAANNVLARLTTEWGGNVGYQHRWTDSLRSNASFGIEHHDINGLGGVVCSGSTTAASPRTTGTGGCGLNKEVITSHVNLIWNPVPFVDVGVEYTYAHRMVVSNLKGDENALMSRFRVQF